MKTLICVVPLVSVLCCGCSFKLQWGEGSSFQDDGTRAGGQVTPLPDPTPPSGQEPAPSGGEPALDAAQQARKDEQDQYVAEVIYQGGHIVASYQLPSGDVVDFIDRGTLPALPYDLPPLPYGPEDLALPSGVELGLTELEQFPELVALAATTTPFQRPNFWPYVLGETDATSIEDYLQRYQVGGQPFAEEHLYAGIASKAPTRGVSGSINQFRPDVEPGTFSLIELAVGCPADGPVEEMVGVVISVDKLNAFGSNKQPYTDGEPRLHIEYARPNPITGQVEYFWDGKDGQFRPNPFRQRYHPGQKVPFSVVGGTQIEHLVAIFQAPVTGDWWIAYRDELLGYYPASLFKTLNGPACISAWYGEAARWRPASPTGWAKTEMGSAQLPTVGGLLNTAYVRDPKYYDTLWFGMDAKVDLEMGPFYVKSCYDYLNVVWGAHRFILMGGPGGKVSGCKLP